MPDKKTALALAKYDVLKQVVSAVEAQISKTQAESSEGVADTVAKLQRVAERYRGEMETLEEKHGIMSVHHDGRELLFYKEKGAASAYFTLVSYSSVPTMQEEAETTLSGSRDFTQCTVESLIEGSTLAASTWKKYLRTALLHEIVTPVAGAKYEVCDVYGIKVKFWSAFRCPGVLKYTQTEFIARLRADLKR